MKLFNTSNGEYGAVMVDKWQVPYTEFRINETNDMLQGTNDLFTAWHPICPLLPGNKYSIIGITKDLTEDQWAAIGIVNEPTSDGRDGLKIQHFRHVGYNLLAVNGIDINCLLLKINK